LKKAFWSKQIKTELGDNI